MSVRVTWPRTTNVTQEEELLRRVFKYIGVDPDKANNAALISMVKRYYKVAVEGE